MFLGEYHHNLDAKGRLAIPVKFRESLKGGAVVTRGLDNCLTIYSKNQWNKIAQQLSALPMTNPNARAYIRFMLAGAMEVDLDRSGRVVLPQYLREFANLSGAVVVAGLFNRIEIWNEKDWHDFEQKAEKDSSAIASQLTDSGI